MPPKLIGYLCKSGAFAFYETGHALLRNLPRGFQALPVLHLPQVGFTEIAKAFRLGAAGVLLAGCETCRAAPEREAIVQQHAELVRELERYGGSAERLVLAWCTAAEPEKFFAEVSAAIAKLQDLPPLSLPRTLEAAIAHCG